MRETTFSALKYKDKIRVQTYSMLWLVRLLLVRLCCSWLHRLELLRQAQKKDGNSGH